MPRNKLANVKPKPLLQDQPPMSEELICGLSLRPKRLPAKLREAGRMGILRPRGQTLPSSRLNLQSTTRVRRDLKLRNVKQIKIASPKQSRRLLLSKAVKKQMKRLYQPKSLVFRQSYLQMYATSFASLRNTSQDIMVC